MCGLSLAWVTSENSTMLLESDSSWLTVAGPYPMLPRLSAPVSGVDCPCPFFHANSLLLASLLSSRQLPSPGSRRQLPFASPYHFRIRRDFRSKNPLSGFAPKQTKESSALAAYPHSATGVCLAIDCTIFPFLVYKDVVYLCFTIVRVRVGP